MGGSLDSLAHHSLLVLSISLALSGFVFHFTASEMPFVA